MSLKFGPLLYLTIYIRHLLPWNYSSKKKLLLHIKFFCAMISNIMRIRKFYWKTWSFFLIKQKSIIIYLYQNNILYSYVTAKISPFEMVLLRGWGLKNHTRHSVVRSYHDIVWLYISVRQTGFIQIFLSVNSMQ